MGRRRGGRPRPDAESGHARADRMRAGPGRVQRAARRMGAAVGTTELAALARRAAAASGACPDGARATPRAQADGPRRDARGHPRGAGRRVPAERRRTRRAGGPAEGRTVGSRRVAGHRSLRVRPRLDRGPPTAARGDPTVVRWTRHHRDHRAVADPGTTGDRVGSRGRCRGPVGPGRSSEPAAPRGAAGTGGRRRDRARGRRRR
jgi:hypothetical protein